MAARARAAAREANKESAVAKKGREAAMAALSGTVGASEAKAEVTAQVRGVRTGERVRWREMKGREAAMAASSGFILWGT